MNNFLFRFGLLLFEHPVQFIVVCFLLQAVSTLFFRGRYKAWVAAIPLLAYGYYFLYQEEYVKILNVQLTPYFWGPPLILGLWLFHDVLTWVKG